MSFSFNPNNKGSSNDFIREVRGCEGCIHHCPFSDDNIYCTVKDKKLSKDNIRCDAYRRHNKEQKRIIVVNAPFINKFIIPGYSFLYIFNGFCCIAKDSTLNDFELLKEILDTKNDITKGMKERYKLNNPMYRLIFFAEKVGDDWLPIYENIKDYNPIDLREQLAQLHKDFD